MLNRCYNPSMAIHIELEQMYDEQKKEILEKYDALGLDRHAAERVKRVKELLPEIELDEVWNCHYVAYLLLASEDKEDYKLAHDYAKKSVAKGSSISKWLFAATEDRILVSEGKKQKYGTQFKRINGTWELLPTDNTINDNERAEYGVPPLSQALEKFLERNK